MFSGDCGFHLNYFNELGLTAFLWDSLALFRFCFPVWNREIKEVKWLSQSHRVENGGSRISVPYSRC